MKHHSIQRELIGSFRERIRANDNIYGLFQKALDSAFIESAGYSGFDFTILDMEHGPASVSDLKDLTNAALLSGILPVVRVPSGDRNAIAKSLDAGALGVQVPQINSPENARQAVQAAKFAPSGERGVCKYVKAAAYSAQAPADYFSSANDCIVVLQVEGEAVIRTLEPILEIEGYDVLFVGPYDLSQSLGVIGEITHDKVIEVVKKVIKKARSHEKCVGIFCDTVEQAHFWRNLGVQYIAHSVDVGIFSESLRHIRSKLHQR